MQRILMVGSHLLLILVAPVAALDNASLEKITADLKQISSQVAPEVERELLRTMLGRALREQIASANRASSDAWANIQSRADWERFRQETLVALRKALGPLPARPAPPRTLITGRIRGEGFEIQNLVFESRPGLIVTANLYVP